MSKTYWISVHSDYRTGAEIICDEDEVEYVNTFGVPFDFELPTLDYKLFLIENYLDNLKILYQIESDSFEECDRISNKIYSQYHGSMPFYVTGFTSSYKQTGYYPEIPKEIKEIPDIEEASFEPKLDNYYFVIIIDNNGNIAHTQPIIPN